MLDAVGLEVEDQTGWAGPAQVRLRDLGALRDLGEENRPMSYALALLVPLLAGWWWSASAPDQRGMRLLLSFGGAFLLGSR